MLVWNVRGLNARAARNVVRELVAQERISILTLQETKLERCDDRLILELLGAGFDYFMLPVSHVAGGILLAWRRDTWSVTNPLVRQFTLTAQVRQLSGDSVWWLSCVYGPQSDQDKIMFLQELRDIRSGCAGMWMIAGDFNMIYRAADKNNHRLNQRMMSHFRRFLDDMELQELHLHGRLYTWSNERDSPTLERIDRVFVSEDWVVSFPNHNLRALSSERSDHAPLLLQTDCVINSFRRFRFENIWPRYDGCLQVIQEAWTCPWPANSVDAFRTLDYKLRNTATALKRWSAKHVGSVRLQLAIAKEIVFRFDQAQDFRQLAPHERSLRNKMKYKSLGLASLLRTIMRQRSRITYLAEGDANTKFFHLQACHRSRKSHIASLTDGDQLIVHEDAKADLIFRHFDEMLGTHSPCTVSLDFQSLGIPSVDMAATDYCFSEDEVWRTIQEMPIDKAPGPDGFTGLFYRFAWPIIKNDIMRAFHALWSLDARSLYLVNQAYMVLLRKKDDAALVGDYRPISLIHSFSKLFTKVLANRITTSIPKLVRDNQSAFIKGRLIHDNFRAVQLSTKALHRSKKPSALIKVDIAKAFDTVSWTFLLNILKHMGFTRRWLNWISFILSTASTKIILNGSPGRRICHARGLRQGDPLSPLLFVLVMEALNSMFKLADRQGLLSSLGSARFKERLYLYADDVVFFLCPNQQDLVMATTILKLFGSASGLCTNSSKCLISPIQCNLEDTVNLLRFFPGRLQQFPCRYLGIPLAPTRLRKNDLLPLVDKISAGLPTWKANLLTRAGRTVLVKVKMSAIPVHTAIAVALSPWAIQCIDRRRRAFLWKGTEQVSGGHCLIAWTGVCRPSDLGGLGVPNLQIMGYALRMRWLWLEKADNKRPWSRLQDRVEPLVESMFRASIFMIVGDGKNTLFWTDKWIDGQSIAELAPCLLQAVGPQIRKSRTVHDALQDQGKKWVRDITGALTVQVILDYLYVWDQVRPRTLNLEVADKPWWRWTTNGQFSSASAYRAYFVGQQATPGAKILTKTRAPAKCKFFVWLALHDRCWTAARRKRHNLQDDDSCILCGQEPETIYHLLIGCSFSREVWFSILQLFGAGSMLPMAHSLADWWAYARKRIQKDDRKAFDTTVILVVWCLWLERNARTFNRSSRTAAQLESWIREEANVWAQARYKSMLASPVGRETVSV